jgi:hypothetical protein
MKNLPIPFRNYMPAFLAENLDEAGQALADKIDNHIDEWFNDIIGLSYFFDPFRSPTFFLDELNYYLNAGFFSYDTEEQKRVKIATAIQTHKRRGSWENDAKIKIDLIAGGDSVILRAEDNGDWILLGCCPDEPEFYWATLGYDGIDLKYGLDLFGDFDELGIPGNIYIDVDNDSLTPDEVNKIVAELEADIAPAYMRIFLGYVNISGQFILYTIIE